MNLSRWLLVPRSLFVAGDSSVKEPVTIPAKKIGSKDGMVCIECGKILDLSQGAQRHCGKLQDVRPTEDGMKVVEIFENATTEYAPVGWDV